MDERTRQATNRQPVTEPPTSPHRDMGQRTMDVYAYIDPHVDSHCALPHAGLLMI